MKKRDILKTIQGAKAVDGAGVHLVRVIGKKDTVDFDPFLMLDSFDSENPDDYVAGFPMHPHRGIETITYLIKGRIDHEDSLGNKDAILEGESQWMTAGSGILHQEMPQAADSMLGFQLWLNLPAKHKMTDPAYLSITNDMMQHVRSDEADVRVLTGRYKEISGTQTSYVDAAIYDVTVKSGKTVNLSTNPYETVFIFVIKGDVKVNEKRIPEKTAVLFGFGDFIEVSSDDMNPARFIFFSGLPLHEPIAWGGPIVMNTKEELTLAFAQLDHGTFIKHQ